MFPDQFVDSAVLAMDVIPKKVHDGPIALPTLFRPLYLVEQKKCQTHGQHNIRRPAK